MIDKLFIIQWNGTVVPCCQCYDNQFVYGHVDGLNIANFVKIGIAKLRVLIPGFCDTCKEVDCDIPVEYKLQ